MINHYNKLNNNKKSINEIYLFTEVSLKITDDLIIDLFNKYSTEGVLLLNSIDILNKNLNINLQLTNNITLESFTKALNNHKTIKLKKILDKNYL